MQPAKDNMTTVSSVLEKLRLKKYDNEFRLTTDKRQLTSDNHKTYNPEDLRIIRTYRFEGESNPDDNAVIYVIRAPDGLIGYSLDAYGVYSEYEEGYAEVIRKIPIEREEWDIFD